jgi:hypothetical protein
MADLKVHKQVVNRLLEPFVYITTIISATDWNNFYALRVHPDAEPHFQDLAAKTKAAIEGSMPRVKYAGEWHLPLVNVDEEDLIALEGYCTEDLVKISAGRCCRVSYLTHEGKRDPLEDFKTYEKLVKSRPLHASPLEHQAKPQMNQEYCYSGNFYGWTQYRKLLPFENVTG